MNQNQVNEDDLKHLLLSPRSFSASTVDEGCNSPQFAIAIGFAFGHSSKTIQFIGGNV